MSKGQHECPVCESDHHAGCVNLACPIGYHNVLWKNPQEITDDIPNPYTEEMHKRWCSGRVRGIEDAESKIRNRAGAEFAKGNDTRATDLRQIADDLSKMALEEAKALRPTGS